MWLSRFARSRVEVHVNAHQKPKKSIYEYEVLLNDNRVLSLSDLQGKKILIVNTASDCGYTQQYDGLQQLSDRFGKGLQLIAFPSNDFKEQEKGSDEEIARFCQLNFNIRFPIAKKSSVLNGMGQHPIFEWLSNPDKNGWNHRPPSWNFTKYLVNEEGILTHYFDPTVEPMSEEILNAVMEPVVAK